MQFIIICLDFNNIFILVTRLDAIIASWNGARKAVTLGLCILPAEFKASPIKSG